jgi:cytochrome c-type biogenesis protein CcmE
MSTPHMTGTVLKAKHQRLVLVSFALVALIGAALLAIYALRGQASYFYIPSDIAAHPPDQGKGVRLGGMVEKGTLKTMSDGVTIHFTVTDGKAEVPVRFTGITPDLFVEGSGVVADGRMEGHMFVADTLLAKHDEKYVPREMKDMVSTRSRQAVAKIR